MPLSPDNPNRDRNFVALVLAATLVFAIIMVGYVGLAYVGRDTDAYMRFLTILIVTLIPSALGAWQAFASKRVAERIHNDMTNGVLKDKVKEGVAEVLSGDNETVTYSGGTAEAASTKTVTHTEEPKS